MPHVDPSLQATVRWNRCRRLRRLAQQHNRAVHLEQTSWCSGRSRRRSSRCSRRHSSGCAREMSSHRRVAVLVGDLDVLDQLFKPVDIARRLALLHTAIRRNVSMKLAHIARETSSNSTSHLWRVRHDNLHRRCLHLLGQRDLVHLRTFRVVLGLNLPLQHTVSAAHTLRWRRLARVHSRSWCRGRRTA